jgi:hypothetical protein
MSFWRTGTAARYRDDGAPGPRPEYTVNYHNRAATSSP